MISITKLGYGDYVHIPDREDAIKFCNLLHSMGFKWRGDSSYKKNHKWDTYKSNMCYYFDGSYSHKKYVRSGRYREIKLTDLKEWVELLHPTDNDLDMWRLRYKKCSSHTIEDKPRYNWVRTKEISKINIF